VRDGRLTYVHNLYGKERHVIAMDKRLTPGPHDVQFAFTPTRPFAGTGTLTVDDEEVATGEIPRFTLTRFNITGAGLTCGREHGPAIGEGYTAPFPFNGKITLAVVEVEGDVARDPASTFQRIMAEE
jgi:hypothetical protein